MLDIISNKVYLLKDREEDSVLYIGVKSQEIEDKLDIKDSNGKVNLCDSMVMNVLKRLM